MLNYTFIKLQEFLPVISHPWKPEKNCATDTFEFKFAQAYEEKIKIMPNGSKLYKT